MMNQAFEEKKRLRAILKKQRAELTVQKREAMDKAIFERVISMECFKNASTILFYASTAAEVDTRALIYYTLMAGKKTALPVCSPKEHIMNFYEIKSLAELVPSYCGIDEPITDKAEQLKSFGNALCIVPAIAFDRDGFRIGYGGGYYDRFLSEHKEIFTAGLCYNELMLDRVPRESFDMRVNRVVT